MNQPEIGGSGLVQTKITISEVTEWAMGKLIWFKYESRNELILVKKLSSRWTQKAGKCVISNLSDIVQDYRDKCLKDKEGVAVLAASYREIGEHSGQQQHSSLLVSSQWDTDLLALPELHLGQVCQSCLLSQNQNMFTKQTTMWVSGFSYFTLPGGLIITNSEPWRLGSLWREGYKRKTWGLHIQWDNIGPGLVCNIRMPVKYVLWPFLPYILNCASCRWCSAGTRTQCFPGGKGARKEEIMNEIGVWQTWAG